MIAGWGNDEFGRGTTLRAGVATISRVGNVYLETEPASGTSGVCSGDSGGAIFLSEGGVWAIAGVTSATSLGGSCVSATGYYVNLGNPDVRAFVATLVPDALRR